MIRVVPVASAGIVTSRRTSAGLFPFSWTARTTEPPPRSVADQEPGTPFTSRLTRPSSLASTSRSKLIRESGLVTIAGYGVVSVRPEMARHGRHEADEHHEGG